MPISHYIKQFQDTLLLFFQDLVIRLCTILDEVPLLHEDRHKAASVELISSYNTTHEFESNNFVEEGNTSSADLISIWIFVATCTLGILILKRGLDFIRGVLSSSNPNSSVRDSVKNQNSKRPSTSSIYYDLPSNLGPYSKQSSPVKSKHFMETYKGKGPVSFLLGTTTGSTMDVELVSIEGNRWT